jgi:hypothetical protein
VTCLASSNNLPNSYPHNRGFPKRRKLHASWRRQGAAAMGHGDGRRPAAAGSPRWRQGGAPATPDHSGGAAEDRRNLGNKEEGLGEE